MTRLQWPRCWRTVRVKSGFGDVRVDVVRDDAPAAVRAEAVSRETFMKDLAGLPVVYLGDPLLPHPALSQWLGSRVGEGSRESAVISRQ